MNFYDNLEGKQLQTLLQRANSVFLYALLYVVIFYLVIPLEQPDKGYISWAIIYALLSTSRIILNKLASTKNSLQKNVKSWLFVYDISLILSALCLCYLLTLFSTDWPVVNQISFFIIYASLISGSVSLFAIRLKSYLCFALPILLGCAFLPLTLENSEYQLLSVLFIIFVFGCLRLAIKSRNDFTSFYLKEVELAETNKKLESIASKDPLTRLPNRRAYDEYYLSEWDRHKRAASVLSILIVDVDHFKEYNDNYGHSEGDTCLIRLANIINKHLKRPGDIAYRYGGEEFVIILPETNTKGAIEVAERIRNKIENLKIPHAYSETSPYVTVSIGVASIDPSDENDPQSFFDEADSQLYKAKENGRNKICVNTNSIASKNEMEIS